MNETRQPFKPFILRRRREDITRERDPAGRWSSDFPEMIGYGQQGGGHVPEDFVWTSSPKQWQEELTEADLTQRPRILPAGPTQAALPPGEPAPQK